MCASAAVGGGVMRTTEADHISSFVGMQIMNLNSVKKLLKAFNGSK